MDRTNREVLMEKLGAVQMELKTPKSQFNAFGKYNYRNADDILEAVKPLLSKNELVQTISDEIVMFDCAGESVFTDELKKTKSVVSNSRFYVKSTVTVHYKDASHSVSAFARESLDRKGMDDSQITGATSSYSRKYAMNGMYSIDDTKDADHYDNKKEPSKPSTPAQPATQAKPQSTQADVNIVGEIRSLKYNETKKRSEYGIETPDNELITVLIKDKPLLEGIVDGDKVEVIGYSSKDYNYTMYHFGKDIKLVKENNSTIPF